MKPSHGILNRLFIPAILSFTTLLAPAQSGASLPSITEAGGTKASTTETSGTVSKYQSAARPFGLDIANPVMMAGSDEASARFQKTVLPAMTAFLNKSLGESGKIDDSRLLLDPANLKLSTTSDVRVYFLGEGAGYRNTLGYNTSGGSVKGGDPTLIFPDASSTVSTYNPGKESVRADWAPLLPGDFVDLGRMPGGTLLDFFLISDGAAGGRNVFSTDQSVNSDGINHVIAFAYQMANSPYLILGFEDMLGGGDRDFNDVLFAIDIGAANIRAITAAPEPAMALSLVSFLGLALGRRRSNRFAA